jgi:hypothetical protein
MAQNQLKFQHSHLNKLSTQPSTCASFLSRSVSLQQHGTMFTKQQLRLRYNLLNNLLNNHSLAHALQWESTQHRPSRSMAYSSMA